MTRGLCKRLIMQKKYYLDHLLQSQEFRFDDLVLKGIDNIPVKENHESELFGQEIGLFHQDMSCSDDYLETLHDLICKGLSTKKAAPVVRFADGEYAFYANNLQCNGLYRQAESIEAIKKTHCQCT